VISENYMNVGGRARATLDAVRERYPVVLHGVALSIGTTDPLDLSYLDDLGSLAASIEPAWVTDHLCFTNVGGKNSHDLLPIPYTEEALAHVIDRVRRVQDRLKRPIGLENPSSYVAYRVSEMPEWEFLARLSEAADCGLLLDVNNVYVSSVNHRFDPHAYLAGIPRERVWQFHLAGHSSLGELLLDTHDHAVPDPVWALYDEAVGLFGEVSSLVEWDDLIPPFEELEAERNRARARAGNVLASAAATEGAAFAAAATEGAALAAAAVAS